MKERVQSITIAGRAGRLEGLIHTGEEADPAGIAVICHPDPSYGGNMHNKVVYRIDRGLFRAGMATLRFNYRGVGASDGHWGGGEGEEDDARSAADLITSRFPGKPLVLAGFSFGAAMAFGAGWADPRAAALLAAGAPPYTFDGRSAAAAAKPILLIHGDRDEVCPLEPVARWAADLPPPSRVVVVPGADHFFARHLDQIEASSHEAGKQWTTVTVHVD